MHDWPPEVLEALTAEVRYQCARARRRYPWLDPAAIESAAWLGAVKAASKYKPDGRAKIQTYARHRIRGQIRDDAYTIGRYSLAALELPAFDTGQRMDRFAVATERDRIVAKRTIAKLLARVQFDARYLRLIQLHYFEGLTTGEIAPIFGLHQSRICQMLQLARKKLREAAIRKTRPADTKRVTIETTPNDSRDETQFRRATKSTHAGKRQE